MDSAKLKKIEDVYHSALELSETEQEGFFRDLCENDVEIIREVKSLLALKNSADRFLEDSPDALAAEMLAAERSSRFLGKLIGHYRIKELLGTGGMGEVYLAEDQKLDRQVALKFLPQQFASDKDRLTRFIREARAASSLNHPNIITIYEIDEVDGAHFIATEFIDGKTLNALIAEDRLSREFALNIAVQIASALAEAHSEGIIHRDIKPDNIIVRSNGLAKILDFGIAKFVGSESLELPDDSDLINSSILQATNSGSILGTPHYMSPEQAKGAEIGAATDIFSFGVMLYEMFAGELPFHGKTAKEIRKAILEDEPKSLPETVDEKIARIIFKCIEKDTTDRYRTIKEVLFDLTEVSKPFVFANTIKIDNGNTGQMPAFETDYNSMRTTGIKRNRRNSFRLYTAIAAIVLLSAAGIAAYLYFGTQKQIRSIAVMPFVNASGEKEAEYLSDGITESLINNLSKIPGLSVKARNSVFAYKGKDAAAKEIGAELGVDAVLFGRMTRQNEDLRMSLELVDTATGNLVWSNAYNGKLNDLNALQIIASKNVAEELRLKLSASDEEFVARRYTANPEAQQAFLKGKFHWNKRNVRDLKRAVEYFSQAVEKDPDYALAYTGLAQTYALIPLYGDYRPKDYIPRAQEAARKALAIDEQVAEAHALLGYLAFFYDHNPREAERQYKRAIELNPNYPTAHQWYAEFLAFRGKQTEAIAEISKALELDPLSLVINRMKGNILGFGKRYDEALVQLRKTEEMYPDNALVKFNIGDLYASKKMYAEAVEHYLAALKLSGKDEKDVEALRSAFDRNGWSGFWEKYLETLLAARKAALAKQPNAYIKNESIAYAYAAAGNKEKAIEYLNLAFEERDPDLITIRMSDVYGFLEDDPRYRHLIKKIGLID